MIEKDGLDEDLWSAISEADPEWTSARSADPKFTLRSREGRPLLAVPDGASVDFGPGLDANALDEKHRQYLSGIAGTNQADYLDTWRNPGATFEPQGRNVAADIFDGRPALFETMNPTPVPQLPGSAAARTQSLARQAPSTTLIGQAPEGTPQALAATQDVSLAPPRPNVETSIGDKLAYGGTAIKQGGQAIAAYTTLQSLQGMERHVDYLRKQIKAAEDGGDPHAAMIARRALPRYERELEGLRAAAVEAVQALGLTSADLAAMPVDSLTQDLGEAATYAETFRIFMSDPARATFSIFLQTLPSSAPSIVGGTAAGIVSGFNPAAIGIGVGAGSAVMEFGAAINEKLAEIATREGLQLEDLADINTFKDVFNRNKQEIISYAQIRGGVIGGVDALATIATAGLASRIGIARGIVAGAGIESVSGPVGEGLAQAATGQEQKPGEILMEAIPGLVTLPGSLASAGRAKYKQNNRDVANFPPRPKVKATPEEDAELANLDPGETNALASKLMQMELEGESSEAVAAMRKKLLTEHRGVLTRAGNVYGDDRDTEGALRVIDEDLERADASRRAQREAAKTPAQRAAEAADRGEEPPAQAEQPAPVAEPPQRAPEEPPLVQEPEVEETEIASPEPPESDPATVPEDDYRPEPNPELSEAVIELPPDGLQQVQDKAGPAATRVLLNELPAEDLVTLATSKGIPAKVNEPRSSLLDKLVPDTVPALPDDLRQLDARIAENRQNLFDLQNELENLEPFADRSQLIDTIDAIAKDQRLSVAKRRTLADAPASAKPAEAPASRPVTPSPKPSPASAKKAEARSQAKAPTTGKRLNAYLIDIGGIRNPKSAGVRGLFGQEADPNVSVVEDAKAVFNKDITKRPGLFRKTGFSIDDSALWDRLVDVGYLPPYMGPDNKLIYDPRERIVDLVSKDAAFEPVYSMEFMEGSTSREIELANEEYEARIVAALENAFKSFNVDPKDFTNWVRERAIQYMKAPEIGGWYFEWDGYGKVFHAKAEIALDRAIIDEYEQNQRLAALDGGAAGVGRKVRGSGFDIPGWGETADDVPISGPVLPEEGTEESAVAETVAEPEIATEAPPPSVTPVVPDKPLLPPGKLGIKQINDFMRAAGLPIRSKMTKIEKVELVAAYHYPDNDKLRAALRDEITTGVWPKQVKRPEIKAPAAAGESDTARPVSQAAGAQQETGPGAGAPTGQGVRKRTAGELQSEAVRRATAEGLTGDARARRALQIYMEMDDDVLFSRVKDPEKIKKIVEALVPAMRQITSAHDGKSLKPETIQARLDFWNSVADNPETMSFDTDYSLPDLSPEAIIEERGLLAEYMVKELEMMRDGKIRPNPKRFNLIEVRGYVIAERNFEEDDATLGKGYVSFTLHEKPAMALSEVRSNSDLGKSLGKLQLRQMIDGRWEVAWVEVPKDSKSGPGLLGLLGMAYRRLNANLTPAGELTDDGYALNKLYYPDVVKNYVRVDGTDFWFSPRKIKVHLLKYEQAWQDAKSDPSLSVQERAEITQRRTAFRKAWFSLTDDQRTISENMALFSRARETDPAPAREPLKQVYPGFYSRIEHVLKTELASTKTATPDQWLDLLKAGRFPGITKEELNVLGIREYIQEWKGAAQKLGINDQRITNEELRDYVRAHQVEMVDQLQYDRDYDPSGVLSRIKELERKIDRDRDRLHSAVSKTVNRVVKANNLPDYGVSISEALSVATVMGQGKPLSSSRAMRVLKSKSDTSRRSVLEFVSREVLREHRAALANLVAAQDELKILDGVRNADTDKLPMVGYQGFRVPGGIDGTYRELLIRMPRELVDYSSKHFDTDELLHIRLDERLGPDGERVVFIGEMQSDLQQGAEDVGTLPKGTNRKFWARENRRLSDEANTAFELLVTDVVPLIEASGDRFMNRNDYNRKSIARNIVKLISSPDNPDMSANLQDDINAFGSAYERVYEQASSQFAGRAEAIRNLREKSQDARKLMRAVPDAPFRGTTWEQLAIKRALLYAVESGANAVAFATGAQVQMAVGMPDGGKRFYDKRVPDFLKKYLKPWDAKLEEVQGLVPAKTPRPEDLEARDFTLRVEWLLDNNRTNFTFADANDAGIRGTEDLLDDLVQSVNDGLRPPAVAIDMLQRVDPAVYQDLLDAPAPPPPPAVPAAPTNLMVRITPKMRDEILKGQALFQRNIEGPSDTPSKGKLLAERARALDAQLGDAWDLPESMTAPILRSLEPYKRWLPKGVNVNVVRSLFGSPIEGWATPNESAIYLAAHALDPTATFRHEVVHILSHIGRSKDRPHGLFTATEWDALSKAAKPYEAEVRSDPFYMNQLGRRYDPENFARRQLGGKIAELLNSQEKWVKNSGTLSVDGIGAWKVDTLVERMINPESGYDVDGDIAEFGDDIRPWLEFISQRLAKDIESTKDLAGIGARLLDASVTEEAVARLLEAIKIGEVTGGKFRAILDKILKLLDSIARGLTGNGIGSIADLESVLLRETLRALDEGKVASREMDVAAGGPLFSRQPDDPAMTVPRTGPDPRAADFRDPQEGFQQGPSQPVVRSKQDIINRLATGLNMLVRKGEFDPGYLGRMARAGQTVLGQYNQTTGVARVRSFADINTLTHEIGHHLITDPNIGPGLRQVANTYASELSAIASPGVDPVEEGFSEFMRRYVLNPQKARQRAPQFYTAFETYMAAESAEWLATLQQGATDYTAWITSVASADKIAATIVSQARPATVQEVSAEVAEYLANTSRQEMVEDGVESFDWLSNLMFKAFADKSNPVRRARNELTRLYRMNNNVPVNERLIILPESDPYKQHRQLSGAEQKARAALIFGVAPYVGPRSSSNVAPVPTGPSFRDALTHAFGTTRWTTQQQRSFDSYMASRMIVLRWVQHRPDLLAQIQAHAQAYPQHAHLVQSAQVYAQLGGLEYAPHGEALSTHLDNLVQLEAENQTYAHAFSTYRDFWLNYLKRARDGHLITTEQYNEFVARPDYVPLWRDIRNPNAREADDAASPNSVRKGGETRVGLERAVVKGRMTGSELPVLSPIESIMQMAFQIESAIAWNEAVGALADMATSAGRGAGVIGEVLSATEMRALRVNVHDAVLQGGRQAGVNQQDLTLLLIDVDRVIGPDTQATLFRTAERTDRGERILWYMVNGQLRAFRVGDGRLATDLFNAYYAFGHSKPVWDFVTSMLGIGGFITRAGVILDPIYQVRNFFRDNLGYSVSAPGYVPFLTGFRGLYEIGTNSEFYQSYIAAGGVMGGPEAANIDIRGKRADSIRSPVGNIWSAAGIKRLLQTFEYLESGPRVGYARVVYYESLASGRTRSQALRDAVWVSRDIMDFHRGGAATEVMRRTVPFFGAAVVGTQRAVGVLAGTNNDERGTIIPQLINGQGPVWNRAQQDPAFASQAWRARIRLVGLIIFGMAMYMISEGEDDGDEDNQYEKSIYWKVKIGSEWIFIPKPYDFAPVIAAAEAAYKKFIRNNDRALSDFWAAIKHTLVPPTASPLLNTMYGAAANYDFFREAPIETEQMRGKEPHLRSGIMTSEFSKATADTAVGRALGLSPAMMDFVIASQFATMGRYFLSATNGAIPSDRPSTDWRDFTGGVVRPINRSTMSGQRFRELMGEGGRLTQTAGTFASHLESGQNRTADEYLSGLTEQRRTFAIMKAQDRSGAVDLHPLGRAQSVNSILGGLLYDAQLDKLRQTEKGQRTFKSPGQEIRLSPADKLVLEQHIREIQKRETANGLKLYGEPGWVQRDYYDTEMQYAMLRERFPQIFEEMQRRMAQRKVTSFKSLRETWPEIRGYVNRPDVRQDAAQNNFDELDREMKQFRRRISNIGEDYNWPRAPRGSLVERTN